VFQKFFLKLIIILIQLNFANLTETVGKRELADEHLPSDMCLKDMA